MRIAVRGILIAGLVLGLAAVFNSSAAAALDGGTQVTEDLWVHAVLEPPGGDVTLIWQMVGTEITASGDQVISGYFYADPAVFAYGSPYNPEVFVKIYIRSDGWCNIAFNHVTVDDVIVSSADVSDEGHDPAFAQGPIQQLSAASADQVTTITTNNRLAEHIYTGVRINRSLAAFGPYRVLGDRLVSSLAATARDGGYVLASDLWAKAVLQVSTTPVTPVTLVWKEVGSDTTPSGARVVSGYFYADPADFAYGSMYNPEVFVKVYIDPNGWANMAFNHVTVDEVTVCSAHQYAGSPDKTEAVSLYRRLQEHEYTGVSLQDPVPDTTAPTTPTGLSVSAISSSRIDLSWTASTDDVGVAGYHIYRGGAYLKSVTTTSASDTNLNASTQYCYTVSAYDAAGNVSGQSGQVCATTAAGQDTTAPTIPTGLSASAISSSRIDLSWTASTDDVGVAGYHIYRGGVYLKSVTSTSSSDQDLNPWPPTQYCYTVSAYDAAGNTSSQSGQVCATNSSDGPDQTYTNSLGMTFNLIPAGTFNMGSPSSELGRGSDETQHQVTLTQSYYMQTTEVTQGQWRSVMGNNPSYFSNCGDDCPVEMVSCNDIQSFITAMNQRGEGSYRLPTEAEWEYAARAGSSTAFANGDISDGSDSCLYDPNLAAMGWYCYNSGSTTHPVAQKQANAWGLYDMHGNVYEWCQDGYGSYPTGAVTDPTGQSSSSLRVNRGGSWFYYAGVCRSAARNCGSPTNSWGSNGLGFRLVALPGQ